MRTNRRTSKKTVQGKPAFHKVSKDFCGECELRQLPKDTYFRTVDKNGKVSRETYTKGRYDYAEKKFECAKHSDIWGNGRALKGTTRVTTDFIY
jgi:hypothetical protein